MRALWSYLTNNRSLWEYEHALSFLILFLKMVPELYYSQALSNWELALSQAVSSCKCGYSTDQQSETVSSSQKVSHFITFSNVSEKCVHSNSLLPLVVAIIIMKDDMWRWRLFTLLFICILYTCIICFYSTCVVCETHCLKSCYLLKTGWVLPYLAVLKDPL